MEIGVAKPSTVLLVSYHFHPSNEIGARRPTALARFLVAKGLRVVVVSAFGHQHVESGGELSRGIVAIPVKVPPRTFIDALVAMKRNAVRTDRVDVIPDGGQQPAAVRASASRLISHLRGLFFRLLYFVDQYKKWSWQASKAAVRAGREYDATLIVASAPPDSTLLAGAWAARRLGIPYVPDLRDPWSDSLSWAYPARRIELRLLRILERWVMRSAAAVTSTGASVAALLAERYQGLGSRIHVIRNGYDGGIAPRLSHTDGRLSILFAGELYVGRDPFPLLSGLEWLLARPEVDSARVQVTFMGNASSYDGQSLQAWMQGKRCASVVRILPPQTPEGVAAAVAQSTVLLNLAQQQRLSVPAKTYEHLASGREVLLICEDDCETARLVSAVRGVNQVDPADFHALTQTLLDLYNRHVVRREVTAPAETDVSRFSRASANGDFYAVLASVAALRVAAEGSPAKHAASAAGSPRHGAGLDRTSGKRRGSEP